MAKNDYEYIVFKILIYLYGCFKREYSFDQEVFNRKILHEKNGIADEYLTDILRGMTTEELIEGLNFTKAWGNEYILINDIKDATITPAGIRYLKDNSKMSEIKNILVESPGAIAELIKIVLP